VKKHSQRYCIIIKRIQQIFILIIIFNFLFIINQTVSSNPVENSIIYVSNSDFGNFSTIQEAIDATEPYDTIYVFNGTYSENIVIDKTINLIGENKTTTIIDGRSTGNVIKVNAEDVVIQEFTIQHSGLIFPNAGINLSSDYNVIQGNILMNNYYGMTLYDSSNNSIKGNTIRNNDHCGIYMSKSSNNTITNNTIQNHNFNGIGIYDSSDENNIENNSLNNNDFCGINIRISSNNNIKNNNISDNNIGIHIPQSRNTVENNILLNNRVDLEKELIPSGTELYLIILIVVIISIFGIVFYIRFRKKPQ
jgi:parallel beta-helix repeat protein